MCESFSHCLHHRNIQKPACIEKLLPKILGHRFIVEASALHKCCKLVPIDMQYVLLKKIPHFSRLRLTVSGLFIVFHIFSPSFLCMLTIQKLLSIHLRCQPFAHVGNFFEWKNAAFIGNCLKCRPKKIPLKNMFELWCATNRCEMYSLTSSKQQKRENVFYERKFSCCAFTTIV